MEFLLLWWDYVSFISDYIVRAKGHIWDSITAQKVLDTGEKTMKVEFIHLEVGVTETSKVIYA